MKNIFSLIFICLMIGENANAQTTYTTPASGYLEVQDITTWQAAFTSTVVAGGGIPKIYTIQPSYTLVIGSTGNNNVSMPSPTYDNVTVNVNGKLGFYQSNNRLTLPSSATVTIASGGEIGFVHPSIGQCCVGNAATQISIGGDTYKGPFNFDGPQTGFLSSFLDKSSFWTGADNTTDWNTANNWSNGIPTYTVNAFISPAAFQPTIPAAATYTVNKLRVQPTATLTIASNGGLTVNDVLDNEGKVVVKSGGSLVQTATSITGLSTGTFTIESTLPASVASFIGSPVINQTVNGFGITTSGTDGGQIVPKPACSATAIATGSPYGNLLEMRENATILSGCSQSLWFVKSANDLEEGRGYSLRNGAITLAYSGTVNNGDVSYTGLTNSGGTIIDPLSGGPMSMGWHLVSNPYPSPISLTTALLTGLGFDAQIQRYNNGAWQTDVAGAGTLIAVGQGFQIHKTAVGGTVDFDLTNSLRVVGMPTFYKGNSTFAMDHYLNIVLSNGTNSDHTLIYFENTATDNFDPAFDANRLSDELDRPMVYSFVNNERLSFNALPTLNAGDNKSVIVGVRTEVPGSHTLTFNDVNTLGATVLLEDLKLNTNQIVTEGYVYNFSTVTGDSKERFVLHFTPDATTGISTTQSSNIKLFPNPVLGLTSLVLGKNHGFNNATITDVCGKTILTYALSENDTIKTIDLSELNNGVYFVKLGGNNQTEVIKLIKQ